MPRPSRPLPRARATDWPSQPSNDPEVEVVRLLAQNLRAAIGKRSHRDASKDTGVDHTTIGDILRGETWPDAQTIARLEAGLARDLWPHGAARRLAKARS